MNPLRNSRISQFFCEHTYHIENNDIKRFNVFHVLHISIRIVCMYLIILMINHATYLRKNSPRMRARVRMLNYVKRSIAL